MGGRGEKWDPELVEARPCTTLYSLVDIWSLASGRWEAMDRCAVGSDWLSCFWEADTLC